MARLEGLEANFPGFSTVAELGASLWIFRPAPLLAEAHLVLGDEGRAEELLGQRLEEVTAQGHRYEMGELLRVKGMLRSRQGLWEGSAAAFDQAFELAQEMSYPDLAARVLHEQGTMRAQSGELRQGRQCLRDALAIFRRLGAKLSTERAERALTQFAEKEERPDATMP